MEAPTESELSRHCQSTIHVTECFVHEKTDDLIGVDQHIRRIDALLVLLQSVEGRVVEKM